MVGGLRPGADYVFVVTARNEAGRSKERVLATALDERQLSEHPSPSGSSSQSPPLPSTIVSVQLIMAVVIGAFTVTLVTLLIAAHFVCACRTKRLAEQSRVSATGDVQPQDLAAGGNDGDADNEKYAAMAGKANVGEHNTSTIIVDTNGSPALHAPIVEKLLNDERVRKCLPLNHGLCRNAWKSISMQLNGIFFSSARSKVTLRSPHFSQQQQFYQHYSPHHHDTLDHHHQELQHSTQQYQLQPLQLQPDVALLSHNQALQTQDHLGSKSADIFYLCVLTSGDDGQPGPYLTAGDYSGGTELTEALHDYHHNGHHLHHQQPYEYHAQHEAPGMTDIAAAGTPDVTVHTIMEQPLLHQNCPGSGVPEQNTRSITSC